MIPGSEIILCDKEGDKAKTRTTCREKNIKYIKTEICKKKKKHVNDRSNLIHMATWKH